MGKITSEHLTAIKGLIKIFSALKTVEPIVDELLRAEGTIAGSKDAAIVAQKELLKIKSEINNARTRQKDELDEIAEVREDRLALVKNEVEKEGIAGRAQIAEDLKVQKKNLEQMRVQRANEIDEHRQQIDELRLEFQTITVEVKNVKEERSKLEDANVRLMRTREKVKREMSDVIKSTSEES